MLLHAKTHLDTAGNTDRAMLLKLEAASKAAFHLKVQQSRARCIVRIADILCHIQDRAVDTIKLRTKDCREH